MVPGSSRVSKRRVLECDRQGRRLEGGGAAGDWIRKGVVYDLGLHPLSPGGPASASQLLTGESVASPSRG